MRFSVPRQLITSGIRTLSGADTVASTMRIALARWGDERREK